MEAYIKAFNTFRTTLQRPLLDYTLYLDALNTEKSSATLEGDDLPGTLAREWMVINGKFWWIDTVTPGKGQTQFALLPPDEIFNRKILYDGTTAATIGGFVALVINANWTNQPDAAYATPYIEVTNYDQTPFEAPAVDKNGVFNLLEYIRTVRAQKGVKLVFSLSWDVLAISIQTEEPVTHALALNDGHTQLSSSSFAASKVAKITAIQPVDTGEVDPEGEKIFRRDTTEWYLTTEGTVTDVEPPNRAEGEWSIIVLSESDDPAEKVQAEFAKNGESHKIQLWTDEPMNINDRIRLRLNGEVFEGGVVSKSKRRGDNRTLYTSGELVTTIQERVRQNVSAQQGGYTGDGSGQMYAVGDVFITTRSGNPAALLGYGAWVQIQGRFIFAADSGHSAGSKGGKSSYTLTEDNLPPFSVLEAPELYIESENKTAGSQQYTVASNKPTISTKTIGKGTALTIEPPFFAVFVWVRKE